MSDRYVWLAWSLGGMVTSSVLTLIVIPVIYYLWRRRALRAPEAEAV